MTSPKSNSSHLCPFVFPAPGRHFSLSFNSPSVFCKSWSAAHCFHCNLNLVITFTTTPAPTPPPPPHNSTVLHLDLCKLRLSTTLPGTQDEISGSTCFTGRAGSDLALALPSIFWPTQTFLCLVSMLNTTLETGKVNSEVPGPCDFTSGSDQTSSLDV